MIRFATIEDIPELVTLGFKMTSETRVNRFDYSYTKTASSLEMYIQDELSFVLVAELDGGLRGALVAEVGTHWFGNSSTSEEKNIFVEKQYRKTSIGTQLIKKYIETCLELGVEDITLSHFSGVDQEGTDRLYKKLGFVPLGRMYCYRPGE